MQQDNFVLFHLEGHVAEITINRPEALNAFNTSLIRQLITAFEKVNGDSSIYCVLLDAAGEKAFSAGGDIREEIKTLGPEARLFGELGKKCIRTIEDCRVPVICAAQGYALGGGLEVILVSDITFLSDTVKLGMPPIKLGTVPGWGSTRNLALAVGKSRAKELLYTGRIIDAEEAVRIGLAEFMVPAEKLREKAMAMAADIADKAPIAMQKIKKCIDEGHCIGSGNCL